VFGGSPSIGAIRWMRRRGSCAERNPADFHARRAWADVLRWSLFYSTAGVREHVLILLGTLSGAAL
jgi:hypothetical protein